MPNARSRDPSAVMNGADIWNAAKRGDHVAISRLAEQVRTETSPTLGPTPTPRQQPISPSPLEAPPSPLRVSSPTQPLTTHDRR